MSTELIPSNDLLGYAPMFDRHQILTSVALDEADRAAATRYLARNAPDRTVTTVEELDALGRLSTVLANNGCVWINDGDANDQWASLVEFDPIWRCSADVELPATVIHEGA